MIIAVICWFIIIFGLVGIYVGCKNAPKTRYVDKRHEKTSIHADYMQNKCRTCENFNYALGECRLGEHPNNCFKWMHSDDDYYLRDEDDD